MLLPGLVLKGGANTLDLGGLLNLIKKSETIVDCP